ncbi:hypothetical protein R3P38DRAFT_2579660 [Favolaschia claudopus]|uniref:Uncharacterized protein n=1 Tax=Favolaschia claudopus TaxID=2862362 RepID=A0AAV9ZES2_9AGAR
MTIFDVLHREASTMPSITLMQVYNMLGVYYGMRGDVAMYRQLFNKLGAILLTTTTTKPSLACDDDLLVLDPSSSMEPASYYPQTAAQEWRAAFSANVFLDLAVSLNRASTPVFDPALLLTFRKLAAIYRRDTELNFIRARTVLFLYDTHRLIEEGTNLQFVSSSTVQWSKQYHNLVEDIRCHLQVIQNPLIEASFIREAQVFTLKTCIIIALASLAQLHSIFAPFQEEARDKRQEILDEISGITSMFFGNDLRYLDTALRVCWASAVRPLVHSDAGWPTMNDIFGPHCSPLPREHDSILDESFRLLSLTTPHFIAR